MTRRGRKSNDFSLRPDPKPSPAATSPYVRLAAAVLVKAAEEARAGDMGAVDWLLSDGGYLFAYCVGIDYRAIVTWAMAWAAKPRGQLIIRLEDKKCPDHPLLINSDCRNSATC